MKCHLKLHVDITLHYRPAPETSSGQRLALRSEESRTDTDWCNVLPLGSCSLDVRS